MPSTSNALESALLRSRSAYGSASHGISPKYSPKDVSSRSLLTKTTSGSRPFSLYALYASASFGVKPRHGGHLGALGVGVEHEPAAEELRERLGLPRERGARRVLRDGRAAVGRDDRAVGVEDHERRDAAPLELGAQLLLAVALGEGQREPRHLGEVLAEGLLVAIGRREHDLEVLARGLVRRVRLGELRREAAARRAPVGGEIDGDDLVGERGARLHDLAALRAELGAEHLLEDAARHVDGRRRADGGAGGGFRGGRRGALRREREKAARAAGG